MKLPLVLAALFAASLTARAFPEYHDIADTPAAQAEARQRQLPLASRQLSRGAHQRRA